MLEYFELENVKKNVTCKQSTKNTKIKLCLKHTYDSEVLKKIITLF